MRRQITGGEIEIDYEPASMHGRPCVVICFGQLGGLKLRMALEDAENIGEALIAAVRQAEEAAEN
jgi:hypothetical protein